MKRFTLPAVVAALSMGLAACGGAAASSSSPNNSSGSDNKPYQILALIPLSGPLGAVGKPYASAFQLAVQRVNAEGGADGRKVEITVKDDQANPTTTVSLVQAALNSSNPPDAIIPGLTDNEQLAALPLLTDAKEFSVGTAYSARLDDATKFPYAFQPDPPQSTVGTAMGKAFVHQGYKNIAIVSQNDPLGEDATKNYGASMKALGLNVSSYSFSEDALDLTDPLSKAAASKPDAIVAVSLLPNQQALLLADRQKLGLTDVPFFGEMTWSGDMTKVATPPQLKNAYFIDFAADIRKSSDQVPGTLASYIKSYKSAVGPFQSYVSSTLFAMDGIELVKVAADAAKSTDGVAMATALRNVKSVPAGTFYLASGIDFAGHDINQGYQMKDFGVTPMDAPQVDGQWVSSAGDLGWIGM